MENKKRVKEIREMDSEIEKLNDDCLIEIFKYLTIRERLQIEEVSKRWRILSQRSWCSVKSIDYLTNRTEDISLLRKIRPSLLDKILRLCGRYLKSISIDVDLFAQICHLLPNIQEIELFDAFTMEYSGGRCTIIPTCSWEQCQVTISWLLSHAENITSFQISIDGDHFIEEDFVRILGRMKRLKFFFFHNSQWNSTGNFLLQLPFDTIKGIVLEVADMPLLDLRVLSSVIKQCKGLETFCYNHFAKTKLFPVFDALSSQAAFLKNLSFRTTCTLLGYQPEVISPVSTFVNLEKLDLKRSGFVGDAFLKVVAKTCKKLVHLDLEDCVHVTDYGISHLCSLEKLTALNINHMQKLKNPPLDKLKSLVVLSCSFADEIKDECLCSALRQLHQLRVLDMIGRSSMEILNVAVEVIKMRIFNNKSALELNIRGNKHDYNQLDEKPPSLNLIGDYDITLFEKFLF